MTETNYSFEGLVIEKKLLPIVFIRKMKIESV